MRDFGQPAGAYGYPPTGYGVPPPPGYYQVESPTVKGLFFMLIAGILLLVGIVCFILAIIGWILAIVGFFKIYGDRHSYPEPHPTNMGQSLILYILGVILTIIGVVVIVVGTVGFVLAAAGDGNVSSALDSMLIYLIAGAIITAIGSLLIVFGRYKLLIKLIPENRISLLNLAVIIVVISSILGLIFIPFLYEDLKEVFKDIEREFDEGRSDGQTDYANFQSGTTPIEIVNSILGIVSQILFLLCFYFAYDYQKKNPQLRKNAQQFPQTPYPPPPGYGGYPPPLQSSEYSIDQIK